MTDNQRIAQALIIVDVQAAFVAGAAAVPAAREMLVQVSNLLQRAREGAALVVHLQNDGPAGAVDEPGSPGWELFLPVQNRRGEIVIRKTTDDGFHQTGLAGLLAEHGIGSLAICGLMSEMCVSATARTGLALGFQVVMPHDAHATYDIPAMSGLADRVPAHMVSRVAEWSLGDQADIIAHATDVRFAPASGVSTAESTTT